MLCNKDEVKCHLVPSVQKEAEQYRQQQRSDKAAHEAQSSEATSEGEAAGTEEALDPSDPDVMNIGSLSQEPVTLAQLAARTDGGAVAFLLDMVALKVRLLLFSISAVDHFLGDLAFGGFCCTCEHSAQ